MKIDDLADKDIDSNATVDTASVSEPNKVNNSKAKRTDGIFACNQCEYKSGTNSSLWRHKKILHEGIRYPCGQCEHKSTSAYTLKRHKKTVHKTKSKRANIPVINVNM